MTLIPVGTELPPLTIPIDRTFIVAAAIASRDYQDVHHDPELARARGSEDVFVNILTSNALVERFALAWAGARWRVSRIRIRLGTPAYPGDVLELRGRVVDGEDAALALDVVATTARGAHLRGRAELEPVRPEAD